MGSEVAEALHPVLQPFDLDEDTVESLQDIVAEASAALPEADARELAARLEEELEPFLISFGAEPGSIFGSAFQVAVSLRGLSKDEKKPAAEPVLEEVKKEDKQVAGTKSAGKRVTAEPKAPFKVAAKAEVEKPRSGGPTLEDLCKSGLKASSQGGYPQRAAPAAKAPSNGGPPKSMASLWAAQGNASVDATNLWAQQSDLRGANAGDGPSNDPLSEEDDEDDESKTDEQRRKEREQAEKKTRKDDSRAQRLARSEAAVNAMGAAERAGDLGDIAAHGLRESRDPNEETKGSKKKRGVHVEGANSRNIHLEGVNITLTGEQGSKEVLRDADLHLSAGHVYGLVGKNGSGKTTLLRRLAVGALPGMPEHLSLGYVAQELAMLKDDVTPLEAVVDADEERKELLRERDEIENLLVGADALRDAKAIAEAEARAGRFSEIEQRLVFIDADAAEARAEQALGWLSFDEKMMRRPVQHLSGGWKMRLALARALFRRPDVMLLDEPTNHLDLHGVLWLQDHLRREWGADAKKKDRIVVAVSHDRAFLDSCATDIIEIHDCKLRVFPGNYSSYLAAVEDEQRLVLLRKGQCEHEEKMARQEMKGLKKAARTQGDEKKVRQLKSKEKKIEQSFKLSSAREFGGDGEEIAAKIREDVNLRFKFSEVEVFVAEDTNLLEMDGATIKLGSTPILKKVTLTVAPSSRIAIVGGNGAGKSTLMRALAGELKADEGPRGRGRKHAAYKPGFVSQNHLESLVEALHENCIGHIRALLPDQSTIARGNTCLTKQSEDTSIRAHLGNFGLGRDALKKVGYLSGGQKARLSLASTTWWCPAALLLDEPTNHLDVDSLDALTLGLQAFDGPVIVVSHNRGFLEALCDELWIVKDGTVKVCPKGDEAFSTFFAHYVKECQAAIK